MAGDVPILVVGGPDEYLFGEEKALLEVIEGKPPLPRLLPPYLHGLFATSPQMGWESVPTEPGHQLPEEGGGGTTRTPRWSTTWRRWPTWPTSWPGAPSGSVPWAPTIRPATTW